MSRWVLALWLCVACDSAVGKEVRDYRGERVTSNVLSPPPGAAWLHAEIHTNVYASSDKASLLDRTWFVDIRLLVLYPNGLAFQVVDAVREGGLTATADRMVELAAATHRIELTANGTRVRIARGDDVNSIPFPPAPTP